MSMSDTPRLKLVVVGDGGSGKTTLLTMFRTGFFSDMFLPTVAENYVVDVNVDGKQIELALWDTAGQEDYDHLRPLCYPDTHVVLICFSVDETDSLENVVDKWVPEILHFCSSPPAPYILVGCKMELRTYEPTVKMFAKLGRKFVTEEQGKEVAQRVGATMYLECSSRMSHNVDLVFESAARAALSVKTQSKTEDKCVIL